MTNTKIAHPLFAFFLGLLVVSVIANAQTPASAPVSVPKHADSALQTALLTSYIQNDQALAKVVQARFAAMLATPEGQAYQLALRERQEAQIAMQQKVSQLLPEFVLDFGTGQLRKRSVLTVAPTPAPTPAPASAKPTQLPAATPAERP